MTLGLLNYQSQFGHVFLTEQANGYGRIRLACERWETVGGQLGERRGFLQLFGSVWASDPPVEPTLVQGKSR